MASSESPTLRIIRNGMTVIIYFHWSLLHTFIQVISLTLTTISVYIVAKSPSVTRVYACLLIILLVSCSIAEFKGWLKILFLDFLSNAI